MGGLFEAVKLRAALRGAMELVRTVNGYLAQAPWFGVINADKTAAATTVYTALCAIGSLKVLLAPFVPFSAERVHRALGYEHPLFGAQHIVTYAERARTHEALVYDATQARGHWAPSAMTPGQRLEPPQPLYQKLEVPVVGVE